MLEYDYMRFFPYASIRNEQTIAIDFALKNIDNNKKFIILELGTGCGKSAIGLTVARYISSLNNISDDYLPGSYVLTTQRVLQEQYLNDFAPPKGDLVSIKSSSNYECSFHKQQSCAQSLNMLKNEERGTPFWNKCTNNCVYKNAKRAFLESKESITNYSYFLAETLYSGKITPRELLILDEAHNCENELSRFIELTINEKFTKDALKLEWPKKTDATSVVEWIKSMYQPLLALQLSKAKSMIEKLNLQEKLTEFHLINAQIETLEGHLSKVDNFLKLWSDDNWVLNIIEPESARVLRKFEFKPVDVGPYSDEMLFKYGKNIIMLSATIVNKDVFCETLGINKNDVAFLSIDSPFPIDNRPIYYTPVGNMSQASIEQTLPKMVEMIKLIIEQHKKDKGIIHAHTFRIADYIRKNIKSKRLLVHDNLNRDEMIKKHMESSTPTILVSPSLSEGIDLKDDLSRFQILCKLPYPYLGDKLVKKRMTKNTLWYPFQTAKTIVQGVGRSIRNESDYANTYILDGNWDKFFASNSALFPESFKKALKK